MSDQAPSKQTEWQGFEQFHDASEANLSEPQDIRTSNTASNYSDSLYNVSPQKNIGKLRISNRKKSDNQINLVSEQSTPQEKNLKLSQPGVKINEEKVAPTKPEVKKYERIPIIRYEEDCRYSGKIVYKNFIPRTSDNYMRILKQVDWQVSIDKKRDIRNLHGIEFNSQFEGGNLNLAIEVQVSELQYDLYMRVDSNTNGHRQWFYFSMKNEKKCRVKLHIFRFKKKYSLFQRGMQPYVKSRKSGRQWKPGGDHVIYHYERQRNQYGVKKQVNSFVLTFNYLFEHENDEVFIAAGIPYTYTFMYKQLSFYKQQSEKSENLSYQISTIGRSMCGLDIPLVTIQHKMSKLIHQNKKKKFIIVNARTHSGESSSSWVLDGMLQGISRVDQVQRWLLEENICLKIIPMLNPDGVFIGNYRTGIIGDDFNRRFYSGRKQFYPEIFCLKKLISQCKKEGLVELFLDLHGHSILKNSFFYGPSEADAARFRMKSLPYLLPHNSRYFRLASCKFKTEKENIETARVCFQLKEQILTYTCQNSLGLFQNQSQTLQMLSFDWQNFGQSIIKTMIDTFTERTCNISQTTQIKYKKSQKQASHKANMSIDVMMKNLAVESRGQAQTTKSIKGNRATFKLPSTQKNSNQTDKYEMQDNPFSISQQISRQDQLLQSKHFSFNEKINRDDNEGKQPFKSRRKSEVMKVPTANLVQRIIKKNRLEDCQRKSSGGQQHITPFILGRSSTYDNSDSMKKEIQNANKIEEAEADQYEMEVIDEENFSDQYISINDSDSQGENLPEQEKNYLLEYIKSNQHKAIGVDDMELSDPVQKQEKRKDSKQPKISRFREIRFKSIEQLYDKEAPPKDPIRSTAKKLKLQPHKFKDNTSKSLIYKYNDIPTHSEFDDPTIVTFSQQKRLNERNRNRRTQKDPFVLFQRKERVEQIFGKD